MTLVLLTVDVVLKHAERRSAFGLSVAHRLPQLSRPNFATMGYSLDVLLVCFCEFFAVGGTEGRDVDRVEEEPVVVCGKSFHTEHIPSAVGIRAVKKEKVLIPTTHQGSKSLGRHVGPGHRG